MGRTNVKPIQQPTDFTCGPASLKTALAVFGKRKSLSECTDLCKTNKNGTTTRNLIAAFNKLGFSVLAVEYSTLKHLRRALKHTPNKLRAVIVSYLYDLQENHEPHPDSGHWAVVSSYQVDKSRIVLLDSASAQKKSYDWSGFRKRWIDYDIKHRKINKIGRHFQIVRHWQPQLMLVVARKPSHLPVFTIKTQQLFESEND